MFTVAYWKDEDETGDGVPIGPLTLEDQEAARRDPQVTETRGGHFAQPFGYNPSWRFRPEGRHGPDRWHTLKEAREVAETFGLDVEQV